MSSVYALINVFINVHATFSARMDLVVIDMCHKASNPFLCYNYITANAIHVVVRLNTSLP
jgi:hypothetical protein